MKPVQGNISGPVKAPYIQTLPGAFGLSRSVWQIDELLFRLSMEAARS